MSIAVIDQGAELFWFVRNALLQDEYPLKHLNSISTGEKYILQELPKIVVISGDDSSIDAEKFIGKIRNHVFARNTLFIVVTSDSSLEYKKSLMIAGAGQILYRGKGFDPSPKFFRNLIKWFLNFKSPDPQLIDYKPVQFEMDGEFSTFGRIGWISSSRCYIEVNLDLNTGDSIELRTTLFEELDIKDAKITIIEKNKIGRYYQYSNGYLCSIDTKHTERDRSKLLAWVESNKDISKYKPIKVLYYEHDVDNREKIKSMIKLDKRYCARGFADLENFLEELNYQLPHLIIIDRQMIAENKTKFEPLKKFMKSNFCYCVTYDNEGATDLEEFKKNFDFAMHLPNHLESELLESMIEMLDAKFMSQNIEDAKNKVFLSKYSPYSRMSLHDRCKMTEMAITGIGVQLPFAMTSYCAFEITSQGFTHMAMNRVQYFRSFINKKMTNYFYHQCVYMGQTITDNQLIKITVEKIALSSFEEWKANT